jgi:predicted alpha-1,6-mannanase (GH76 family)
MLNRWIWAGPLAAAAMVLPLVAEAATADEYASRAVAAIDTLNAQWYSVTSGIWDEAWWNSGNMFTILADFASLRLDQANGLNAGGYMFNTFGNAQKVAVSTVKSIAADGMVRSVYCLDDSSGCMAMGKRSASKRGFDDFINEFYDDEGWWALGLIHAYDVTRDQQYLDSAVDIFNDLQTGLGGPCNGGIFWNKERKYVNAITNELYLTVTAALANRIPENPQYLDLAKGQWTWFRQSGMINEDNLINDGLDENCNNNGMQTWSYNQGVILGGLVELSRATGDASLLQEATAIAEAAIASLANEDGILSETDDCELRPGNCGRDGQQFKGIFVRNLRYLHEAAPNDAFRSFILKNADSIWANNRDTNSNMLGVSWSGPFTASTGASHSSALDVIVAAVAVA